MKLSKEKVVVSAFVAVCMLSAIAFLVSRTGERASKPTDANEVRGGNVPSFHALSDTRQETLAETGRVDVPEAQPETKARIDTSASRAREAIHSTAHADNGDAEAIVKAMLLAREDALKVEATRLSQFTKNENIRESIKRFKDASIPLKERLAELDSLAKAGDAESATALMAIGDSAMYLSRHALERLGQYRDSEVAAYLATKLNHGDATLAAAAAKALARTLQGRATPYLNAMILENRQRHDGHEILVRRAAIEAMVSMLAKDGVPVLKSELKSAEASAWDLEYGSTVVNAIAQLGSSTDAKALERYAAHLESICPEEPMPKKYTMSKIEEARNAAERLAAGDELVQHGRGHQ